MTRRRRDYEVGFGRPPTASRWKRGQTGNPSRRRKRELPDAIEIMDRLFSKIIPVVDQGETEKITVLEAILRRIWSMEMAGDKHAARVRLQYEALIPKPKGPREVILRSVPEGGEGPEFGP